MRARLSVIALAGAVVACGPPTNTNPLSPAPTATPRAVTTSLPTGYERFASRAAPYSLCYPSGWAVVAAVALDERNDGDLFVGPAGTAVNMTATVVSEAIRDPDPTHYADDAVANLRARGIGVLRADPVLVDGVTATVISFPKLTGSGARYTVRQTIWAQKGRGWVHIMTSDPQEESRAANVAERMLGCFRATGP